MWFFKCQLLILNFNILIYYFVIFQMKNSPQNMTCQFMHVFIQTKANTNVRGQNVDVHLVWKDYWSDIKHIIQIRSRVKHANGQDVKWNLFQLMNWKDIEWFIHNKRNLFAIGQDVHSRHHGHHVLHHTDELIQVRSLIPVIYAGFKSMIRQILANIKRNIKNNIIKAISLT